MLAVFESRLSTSEITKTASPRWVKELRGGNLSNSSVEKLKDVVFGGSNEVKHRSIFELGAGTEGVVDKVFIQGEGLAARKVHLPGGTLVSRRHIQDKVDTMVEHQDIYPKVINHNPDKNITFTELLYKPKSHSVTERELLRNKAIIVDGNDMYVGGRQIKDVVSPYGGLSKGNIMVDAKGKPKISDFFLNPDSYVDEFGNIAGKRAVAAANPSLARAVTFRSRDKVEYDSVGRLLRGELEGRDMDSQKRIGEELLDKLRYLGRENVLAKKLWSDPDSVDIKSINTKLK